MAKRVEPRWDWATPPGPTRSFEFGADDRRFLGTLGIPKLAIAEIEHAVVMAREREDKGYPTPAEIRAMLAALKKPAVALCGILKRRDEETASWLDDMLCLSNQDQLLTINGEEPTCMTLERALVLAVDAISRAEQIFASHRSRGAAVGNHLAQEVKRILRSHRVPIDQRPTGPLLRALGLALGACPSNRKHERIIQLSTPNLTFSCSEPITNARMIQFRARDRITRTGS